MLVKAVEVLKCLSNILVDSVAILGSLVAWNSDNNKQEEEEDEGLHGWLWIFSVWRRFGDWFNGENYVRILIESFSLKTKVGSSFTYDTDSNFPFISNINPYMTFHGQIGSQNFSSLISQWNNMICLKLLVCKFVFIKMVK